MPHVGFANNLGIMGWSQWGFYEKEKGNNYMNKKKKGIFSGADNLMKECTFGDNK